jgi:arylsulfatase A-like enzyme
MCDGHDLSPLLYGGRTPLREAAFTENPYSRVIRTKEWKLVHTPRAMYPDATTPSYEGGAGGGEVGELYDLVHDPWELENLYGRPEHADRVEALRRQLLDWLITSEHPVTVHPMPVRATPDGEAAGDEIVEDGRLAPAQVRELVRKGQRNYL